MLCYPVEALPVYFHAVRELEAASHERTGTDFWLISSFLLMLSSGLRFSDAQRLSLQSLTVDGESLRGWVWSKESPTGFAFGCLLAGCTRNFWRQKFTDASLQVRAVDPLRDFLLSDGGRPLGNSSALAQFRRCLATYSSLDKSEVTKFTLHSLKTISLSWAGQLPIATEEKAAQGHPRMRNSLGCVEKYRHDDAHPALRCQRRLLQAISAGWQPGTAVQQAVEQAVPVPADGAVADGSETESEGAASEPGHSVSFGPGHVM